MHGTSPLGDTKLSDSRFPTNTWIDFIKVNKRLVFYWVQHSGNNGEMGSFMKPRPPLYSESLSKPRFRSRPSISWVFTRSLSPFADPFRSNGMFGFPS